MSTKQHTIARMRVARRDREREGDRAREWKKTKCTRLPSDKEEEVVVVVEEEEWNIESQHKHRRGIWQMSVPSLVRRKRKIALVWVLNWVAVYNIRTDSKEMERKTPKYVAKRKKNSRRKTEKQPKRGEKKTDHGNHHLPSQHNCVCGIFGANVRISWRRQQQQWWLCQLTTRN